MRIYQDRDSFVEPLIVSLTKLENGGAFALTVPVPTMRPLTLHVRLGYQSDFVVEIEVDQENVNLWPTLANEVQRRAGAGGPSLDDALWVVNQTMSPGMPVTDAVKYSLAATVLTAANATAALKIAEEKDTSLSGDQSTLLLHGVLANRLPAPEQAMAYFDQGKSAAQARGGNDSVFDLFTASMKLKSGHTQAAADSVTGNIKLPMTVETNPELTTFAAQETWQGKSQCTDRLAKSLNDFVAVAADNGKM
jgi:hypothetical protein